MTLNLELPKNQNLTPKLSVFGVGGAGGNAVSNMIASNLEGVNFVVANTDSQALKESVCENKIHLGEAITQGLGAGSYPEVGKASAEEAVDHIQDFLEGSNMVFITAGLGGGTGTGASPVVARLAKERGILTVAVVTKPFHFEGTHRMRVAELGLQELQKFVDTLIVIPNQNLFRVADKNTTFLDAFKLADDVLHSGVRGITDLMVMPGLINLDFSDVRSVMSEMGKAMMGTGESNGEKRAVEAAEAAIANPLLDNVSMKGARGVLINITGGSDMTLFEVDEAANRIREEVDPDANIIFGSAFNQDLEGSIRVSVVATGIDSVADENNVTHIFSSETKKPQTQNLNLDQQEKTENVELSSADETEEDADNVETLDFGNKDSEVEETEKSEGGFEAPEPVKPKTYPSDEAIASINEVSSKLENISSEEEESSEDDKQRSGKLFGGIFGKKDEEESEEETSEASLSNESEETKSNDKNAEDLDNQLDIPAFLRRNSN